MSNMLYVNANMVNRNNGNTINDKNISRASLS